LAGVMTGVMTGVVTGVSVRRVGGLQGL